ncbi:MAG TPA: ATP-dependent DNA helicase RecG [Nocardioidaceae bacterium]|nr:ATP-dependent DNA helicase RecG [Nocardioidaceae bacterium]
MTAITLDTRLDSVLGGKSAKPLATHLDIRTVGDLLRHYPRRYAMRGELTPIADLQEDEPVTVMAKVVEVNTRDWFDRKQRRKRVRIEIIVADDEGDRLLLTFFNQPRLTYVLKPGKVGLFAGKVGWFRRQRQLLHPDFDLLDEEDIGDDADRMQRFNRRMIAVYSATTKLVSWRIARCVDHVLDQLDSLDDPLSEDLRQKHGLIGLAQALEWIHRPRDQSDVDAALQRLRFEEAYVLQTILAQHRLATEHLAATPREAVDSGIRERFEERLPFELTAGQREVGEVLTDELARSHPMHRLLQGDVGSGKTVVALRAMLQVVDADGQAALLAPTEVLAAQHHRSILALLGDLAQGGMLGGAEDGTRVRLLTGSLGAAARRESLADAASGGAGIVVGTHALLEDRVQFADLGMVVVDEQHRFGVEQRAALSGKAGETRPHVLVMTATPIPRTVAMTVFGDLETSTLTELPAGRQPIQTTVVPTRDKPAWLDRTWERITEEVRDGRQAYVVCPRIGDKPDDRDADATDGSRPSYAAVELCEELRNGPLSEVRVELLHGRMHPDAKDDVMTRFAAGDIDALVSTTVIEVGVDVPNATVMVVMDAERFGLSQLHQLRGRVGRGDHAGLCLLVTDSEEGTPPRERLDAVAETSDGFALSELDLQTRHEGDVLGVSQSGRRSSLQLLSVLKHRKVIEAARIDAEVTVRADPDLSSQPALAEAVRRVEESDQADYLDKA